MLQIDGGNHRNTAVQQFADILPAVRIAAAGRIIVSQSVDETGLRVPAEERRHVHGIIVAAGMPGGDQGNHFEALEDLLNVGSDVRLQRAHDNVLAALFPPSPLVEHAERLAHARSVAEEDLQAATVFASLIGLHFAQQFFRIGPHIVYGRHYSQDNPARSDLARITSL